MRHAVLAFALALAACGQAEPPPPLPEPPAAAAPAPWFICDAINAPVLLVFERDGTTIRVAQYDKPNGAIVQRTEYQVGAQEGAAGSVLTTLMQDGAEAGAVRQINPDMLETPGAAYTTPFTSVRISDRDISCRWLPRTRVMGFTGRRTIVVSEDRDGDLIYTSYDFASAAAAAPVELTENGRSTTFSLEARNGGETVGAEQTQYHFQADVETEIIVTLTRARPGNVQVRRHGPTPLQTEGLIAFQQGSGAE